MVAPALSPAPAKPGGLALLFGWRRLRLALGLGLVWGLLLSIGSATGTGAWVLRTVLVVSTAVLAYGVAEQWPVALPRWLARWVLQLLGVVVSIPLAAFVGYTLTSPQWPFWHEPLRLQGYAMVTFMGVLIGPWIALAAMVRQRDALNRHQLLAFALERSELERRAADARLHLLQAQVQPHFLFNTLANVRALVGSGSPQAPRVLDSLIHYLRAAVPRAGQAESSLGDELHRVRAYLDLMHMRMPDRLRHSVSADAEAEALPFPPMALLTLVENAVRHGIDPGEEGGSIDVTVRLHHGRCVLRVADTGVGLRHDGSHGGTGLSTLRERLRLAYGDSAQLRLTGVRPHGVCAEIDIPT